MAYTLKNYGKTPALVEDIAHCVSINETESGPRTYTTPERALEILGLSDETEPIAVVFDERQFIAEDAKSLGDHSTMLFFYSRATFMDAFNRRHIIDSDFLYSAGRFHLMRPAAGPKPSPTVPSQSLRTESEVAGLAGARHPAADWLRECESNARFQVMSLIRGLLTAPIIPRNVAEALNSKAAPAVRPRAA